MTAKWARYELGPSEREKTRGQRQPNPARHAPSWIFQVQLSATGPDDAAVFLPRPDRPNGADPDDVAEQQRLAMAYGFHFDPVQTVNDRLVPSSIGRAHATRQGVRPPMLSLLRDLRSQDEDSGARESTARNTR